MSNIKNLNPRYPLLTKSKEALILVAPPALLSLIAVGAIGTGATENIHALSVLGGISLVGVFESTYDMSKKEFKKFKENIARLNYAAKTPDSELIEKTTEIDQAYVARAIRKNGTESTILLKKLPELRHKDGTISTTYQNIETGSVMFFEPLSENQSILKTVCPKGLDKQRENKIVGVSKIMCLSSITDTYFKAPNGRINSKTLIEKKSVLTKALKLATRER